MAIDPRQELVGSVELLYNNPEFSDLEIITTKKNYHVHKAIVCPRSTYFAEQCRDAKSGESIHVEHDDAETVDRVIEFLYKLDYSDTPATSVKIEGHDDLANGNEIHTAEQLLPAVDHTSAVNPSVTIEDIVAADSLDDFLPRSKNNKKKKKRTKAAAEVVKEPSREGETTTTAADDSITVPASVADTDRPESLPTDDTLVEPLPGNAITAHSRLYNLSAKYGIPSLTALALDRFEDRAKSLWDSDEFVQAAKEIYTLSPVSKDRGMRDVITSVVGDHPTLLDKEGMREVARGGELGFDLVMHLRNLGSFKPNGIAV